MKQRWSRFSPGPQFAFAIALLGLTLALVFGDWLWRADKALYDANHRLLTRTVGDEIVIVAIDEQSLATLGRWPWPRSLHAELIDRLNAAGASTIIFDIIFAEPEAGNPANDLALAAAMQRHGRVILPLLVEQRQLGGQLLETQPLPLFGTASAGVGHAHMELDADGIARSVYLQEGLGTPRWPHMTVAALQAMEPGEWQRLPGHRNPDLTPDSPNILVRDHQILIPFAGPPGHYPRISYTQVIEGRFLPGTFRGKTVLVGTTASGLGDFLPTPVSGFNQPMPGVEINANILDALRHHLAVEPLALWQRAAISLLIVLIPVLFFPLLTPRAALLTAGTLLLATLGLAALLISRFHLWLPPAAIITPLLLAYPLWSWQRLEFASRFLTLELKRLRDEPILPNLWPSGSPDSDEPDSRLERFERRVQAVQQAVARMQAMRRFINDTLGQMADGVVVVNPGGQIVLINPKAADYLGVEHDLQHLTGRSIIELLDALDNERPQRWQELLVRALDSGEIAQSQTRSAKGRDLLVQCAPLSLDQQRSGLVINLSDITRLLDIERARADTLRFLSHDLRTPLVSLLALVDIARAPQSSVESDELLQRVEEYAGTTLNLAEEFLNLSQIEGALHLNLRDVEFTTVALNAIDAVWDQARHKQITIRYELPEEPLFVMADATVLQRVLVNLLGNAIKYSPPQSNIELTVSITGQTMECAIQDHGIGMSRTEMAHLFERFYRTRSAIDAGIPGTGLGLAFVKTALEKMGGNVSVRSEPGQGSRFAIRLPLAREG